jgi:inhibitor of cysteine peptidase
MRLPVSLLAVAALVVGVGPIGCAASTDDEPVSSPTEEGDAEDELRSKSITDADDNQTVTVTKGQNVLVKLSSNPTTGYKWTVASTDRTFGYPAYDKYLAASPNGPVGSGGIQRFTWKTNSPLNMAGSHTVKLEYKRAWEVNVAPAKTFTFTVTIVDSTN